MIAKVRLSLAVVFTLFCPACATMVRGTQQTIHVQSNPEGVRLEDVTSGETWILPAEVTLTRRSHHKLLATLDGYRPSHIYISREVPFHWWLADAFTLGIGALVDALTGGFYDLKPENVLVVMEPADPGQGSSPPQP